MTFWRSISVLYCKDHYRQIAFSLALTGHLAVAHPSSGVQLTFTWIPEDSILVLILFLSLSEFDDYSVFVERIFQLCRGVHEN